MTVYAIDTNIISYYLKGIHTSATNIIENEFYSIPPYVHYEILSWLYRNNSGKRLREYLRVYALSISLPFNEYKVMEKAAQLRIKYEKIGHPSENTDLFIAAWCIENNCTLVTANIKHFKHIEDLKILEITK
jgi:tRNA(fMet)-specific endonuclease VapC